MPWNALADRILAGGKREEELNVEKQSEYDQWVSELHSEVEVFVKRVNGLDLSNSESRSQFYDFTERFSDRLVDLRERSESSGAPAEALIRMDELIEEINETSSQIAVAVAYIGDDPVEKARREKRREEREQKRAKRSREQRDSIAGKIEELMQALE